MSTLGKGGFMTTLRKRVKPGGVGPEGCTRFAVKVVDRDDMPGLGITEADVRREASTLARLRHTHIIRYHGVESSDDEIGIVMELAEGGSLADLIKERAAPGGGVPPRGGVDDGAEGDYAAGGQGVGLHPRARRHPPRHQGRKERSLLTR